MDSNTSTGSFRDTLRVISTIISWTIFTILVICVIFLTYCFISTRIYATKGDNYEPKVSLYTIVSPSMTPNINVYDVIVNLKVNKPDDIKIGDVITFISTNPETTGMTITHRVISIVKDTDGNYTYKTKGDFSLVEDSGFVNFNNIIGRVAFRIPKLGRVQFFLAEKMHWLLVILIPALYILVRGALQRITKGKEFKEYHLFRIGTKNKLLFLPFKKGNMDDKDIENSYVTSNPFMDMTSNNSNVETNEVNSQDNSTNIEIEQKAVNDSNKVDNSENVANINGNAEMEIDLPDLK